LPVAGGRGGFPRDASATGNREPATLASYEMTEQLEELPLLETLDHLLDRGVIIAGEAVISIGDVDLLYLGLNVVLANVDAIIRTSKR
jgi:hypothetical protein